MDNTKENMRAFRASAGAPKPQLERIEVPMIGHNDVLIKVESAGLAPGILKIVQMGRTGHLPLTLGHEAAGTIETIGDAVPEHIKVGQRVRVHPSLSCGTCGYCTTDRDHLCTQGALMGFQAFGKGSLPLFEKYHDGGLADYMRVPSNLVDPLPDNVSFDVGAKIMGLANAVRVFKEAELPIGAVVAITAATGMMGAACVKLAPVFGIRKLILVGRNTERLQAVQKLSGVQSEIISTENAQSGEGPPLPGLVRRHAPEGVDAIIDFMPAGTEIYQIMWALRQHGSFVHMGASMETLPIPLIAIMVNCWKIIGTRSNSREDALCVLRWLKDGTLKVDDLVTHRYKLDEMEEAVRVIEDRSLPIWMMAINP